MDRSDRTRVSCRRIGYGSYIGEVDVPVGDDTEARITVKAEGDSKAEAIANAAHLAEKIVNDPLVQAVMPPQALAAIKGAKLLALAGRRGLPALGRLWGSIRGSNKRKLALALAREAARRDHGPEAVEGIRDWFRRIDRKRKRRRMQAPPPGAESYAQPELDAEPDITDQGPDMPITDVPAQGVEEEASE
jgi:uncharacterized protein (DUF1778 family)